MADEPIPTAYDHTPATVDGAIPASRQPAFSQETHPTTGANDPVPEVRHAGDHDDATGDRNVKEA